jgi:deoxyribose-phosphate aldolase
MNLARMIDHTLLKPDAVRVEIEQLCAEALHYGFAGVCVNPSYVQTAAKLLRGSSVNVCTVIGFPLGATSTAAKVFETIQALQDGAQEVDMVINVGMLKSGDCSFVRNDIAAVVEAARIRNAATKVILETCLLTDEEIIIVCSLAKDAGADFVKTSTGFSKGGATVHDIVLMRKTVGAAIGVKASGGIRTREQALAMIAAGATRIGTSSSILIAAGDQPAVPANS